MKFSDLLGEPEPEEEPASTADEPIGVFAPVPMPETQPPAAPPLPTPPPVPPVPATPLAADDPTEPATPVAAAPTVPPPTGGRSGLAELNVHQPVPEPPPTESPLGDQLTGLDEVVDDLLPPRRGRR